MRQFAEIRKLVLIQLKYWYHFFSKLDRMLFEILNYGSKMGQEEAATVRMVVCVRRSLTRIS